MGYPLWLHDPFVCPFNFAQKDASNVIVKVVSFIAQMMNQLYANNDLLVLIASGKIEDAQIKRFPPEPDHQQVVIM